MSNLIHFWLTEGCGDICVRIHFNDSRNSSRAGWTFRLFTAFAPSNFTWTRQVSLKMRKNYDKKCNRMLVSHEVQSDYIDKNQLNESRRAQKACKWIQLDDKHSKNNLILCEWRGWWGFSLTYATSCIISRGWRETNSTLSKTFCDSSSCARETSGTSSWLHQQRIFPSIKSEKTHHQQLSASIPQFVALYVALRKRLSRLGEWLTHL